MKDQDSHGYQGDQSQAHNFPENEFADFSDYNNELWCRFLFICNREINRSSKFVDERKELTQSLDLIKAINSYRVYKNPQNLLIAFPELQEQKEYIYLVWKHFSTLSQQELSELSIEMIHEVSLCSNKLS